jgi:hypothetical protein
MFNKIASGLSKFFTKERVIILVVFIVLAWALIAYSGNKINIIDRMSNGAPSSINAQYGTVQPTSVNSPKDVTTAFQPPGDYALKPVANPSDLLPKDVNSQWGELNPVNQGNVAMPDLLQAGYHIGLDTIGQTLRNANQQIRSDPIIPKTTVGPWNQSTIEPDLGRVPLEVGYGCK